MSESKNRLLRRVLVLLVLIFIVYVLWQKFFADKASSQPDLQQQALPVSTQTIETTDIQLSKTFSGRLTPVDFAEIRPQVAGVIKDVRFNDGDYVKKGQILFVIDPEPYQATLNRNRAALAAAENALKLAKQDMNRAKNLIKTKSISQKLYDERRNGIATAQAAVKGAQAEVKQAQINLSFAYLKAPITGQAGIIELREGNLVQPGPNAPLLTSIVADKGIFVDFELDEQTYSKYIAGIKNKQDVIVRVTAGGKTYDAQLRTLDNRLDAGSGTIRARAFLENKDNVLLPGLYADVTVTNPVKQQAVVIEPKAIGTNQDRKFVYKIVDNTATSQPIKLGGSFEGKRVILEGLESGDVIITKGIVKIRPGMPVQIKKQVAK